MIIEESFRKNDKQEAITLIALIVTIIVLIILVGVGTAMLTRRKWNTI